MTQMEQCLHYIEREVRFMVRDSFGNPTMVRSADRVVEDVTGIQSFCSTVLSSKRPLTAILRAVRGPRGDVIIRFFNTRMHDARIEMVMVINEALRLKGFRDKRSREAHEYLMKLYHKSVKRSTQLVTGGKDKDAYKALYSNLRSFAQMGSDYDDYDDEDDDDEEFEGDFGDSDYAAEALEAYRNGMIPPEPPKPMTRRGMRQLSETKPPVLPGNEAILAEIAEFERRLGRHLTDAEIDSLLIGDDDDDDDEIEELDSTDPKALASFAAAMAAEAVMKNMMNRDELLKGPYPSLEELQENPEAVLSQKPEENKLETAKEAVTPVETSTVEQTPMTLKEMIELRNKLQNAVEPTPAVEVPAFDINEVMTPEIPEKEPVAEEDPESNQLPPDEVSGGIDDMKGDDPVDITLGMDDTEEEPIEEEIDETSETPEATEEVVEEVEEEESVEPALEFEVVEEPLVVDPEPEEVPPTLADQITLDECVDLLRDLRHDELRERITNYFIRLGANPPSGFIALVPSNNVGKLLTLEVQYRVSAVDPETINRMHLNIAISVYLKTLAAKLEIPEDLFDTEFQISGYDSTYAEDLERCGLWDPDTRFGVSPYGIAEYKQCAAALRLYLYRKHPEVEVDVRYLTFYNDTIENRYAEDEVYLTDEGEFIPCKAGLALFITPKNSDELPEDILSLPKYFFENDFDDYLFDSCKHRSETLEDIRIYVLSTDEYLDRFLEDLKKEINPNELNPFMEESSQEIEHFLSIQDPPITDYELNVGYTAATTPNNFVCDMMIKLYLTGELNAEQKEELQDICRWYAQFNMAPEMLLRRISMNIEVMPYIEIRENLGQLPSAEVAPSPESSDTTSNFGL